MARKVGLSERQRQILERLVDAKKTPQQLAERARIVLKSAEGISNVEQAEILDVDRQRVRRWRGRWADATDALREAEQVAQILALACESPKESGLPVSHWTPADLTREVLKRGIVESISPRHVDRFLRGGSRSTTQGRVLDEAQRKGPRAFP